MNDTLPAVEESDTIDLTPRQEAFCRLYYAGPDDVRGNATEAYMKAYENSNYNSASTSASRLLKKAKIRARIAEIREAAAEEAKNRARDWWEMYPKAQETLRKAMDGELDHMDDQAKRSAIEAAKEVVSRCLGSVKIQHEHSLSGQAIVAHVAGPEHSEEEARQVEDPEGREVPSAGPELRAIEGGEGG